MLCLIFLVWVLILMKYPIGIAHFYHKAGRFFAIHSTKNNIFKFYFFSCRQKYPKISQKVISLGGKLDFFGILGENLPLFNRIAHRLGLFTSTKVYSSPTFGIRFIKCHFFNQFSGIEGFSLDSADFDQIRHFRKMMRHRQTGKTTDNFRLPLRS